MIVTCPACRTRYNYPGSDDEIPASCRCSKCDSTFVPGRLPRSYILSGPDLPREEHKAVPVAPVPENVTAPSEITIGMDDPTLAAKLRVNGLNTDGGADRTVMSYRVVAKDDNEAIPETPDPAATQAMSIEEVSEAPAVENRKPGFGAALFVLIMSAVTAAGGWQLAIQLRNDPLEMAPPAAIIGLCVGWLWVRWKYRSN